MSLLIRGPIEFITYLFKAVISIIICDFKIRLIAINTIIIVIVGLFIHNFNTCFIKTTAIIMDTSYTVNIIIIEALNVKEFIINLIINI